MHKRTGYTFEGSTGYTYVTKAYGSSDVKFEIHFNQSGGSDVDTLHFGVGPAEARSIFRSLTRAMIESDKDSGLDALQCMVNEFQNELANVANSEE